MPRTGHTSAAGTTTVSAADGVPLHVWLAGAPQGRPMLLLHGIGQSGLVFAPLWSSALAERYRLVCPDLRGHGRSGPIGPAGADGAVWGGDVQAVLAGLGVSAPVVLGWSYGAVVALDHLAWHGTARALVLVAPPAGAGVPDARAWYDPGFLALAPGLMSTDAVTYVAAHWALVERCTVEPLDPVALAAMLGEAVRTSPSTMAGVMRRSVDSRPALAGSAAPLLVITGKRDAVITAASAEALVQARPDARLVQLDTGHTPFAEQPDAFAATVLSFLDDLD